MPNELTDFEKSALRRIHRRAMGRGGRGRGPRGKRDTSPQDLETLITGTTAQRKALVLQHLEADDVAKEDMKGRRAAREAQVAARAAYLGEKSGNVDRASRGRAEKTDHAILAELADESDRADDAARAAMAAKIEEAERVDADGGA